MQPKHLPLIYGNIAFFYFKINITIYPPNVQNTLKQLIKKPFQSYFILKDKKDKFWLKKDRKTVRFWFIFEPEFRPKPKSQKLQELKPEPKFWWQFRPEPEPNFGRSLRRFVLHTRIRFAPFNLCKFLISCRERLRNIFFQTYLVRKQNKSGIFCSN